MKAIVFARFGTTDVKTKVMLGLIYSMFCDVKYYLDKCKEAGLTTEELLDIFTIASMVGGVHTSYPQGN